MRGAVIRDAIARGDLDASHAAAASLVEYVTANEHPDPRSKVGEMVEAARRVEAARALPEAAQSFALLSEKCGACHAAFHGPRSVPGAAPTDTAALGPRMRRHEWGAARLWEGLVAPSNEAWSSGARVLSDAPLGSEGSVGNDDGHLAAMVHDLGLKAATSKEMGDRVQIYGQLLTTCATCHQRTGAGPDGPRR